MSKSSDLDIGNGEKTVTTAGTRERLVVSKSEREVLSVRIKALSSNTDKVYVGDNGVSSSNGYPLDPRDEIELASDRPGMAINLSSIFLDVAVDGEGVRYIYLRR